MGELIKLQQKTPICDSIQPASPRLKWCLDLLIVLDMAWQDAKKRAQKRAEKKECDNEKMELSIRKIAEN